MRGTHDEIGHNTVQNVSIIHNSNVISYHKASSNNNTIINNY